MRDAAGRHDTLNQRTAKVRSAEKRRCPECQRKAAMVKTPESYEVRAQCRWCGFQKMRSGFLKSDSSATEGPHDD